MFRASLQQALRKPLLLRSNIINGQSSRKQSTDSGNTAKVVLTVGGVSAVTVGGTVLYAKYDDNFRSKLESSIPYSDRVLNSILGPKNESKPIETKQAIKTSTSPQVTDESLLKKKLERNMNTVNKNTSKEPSTSSPTPSDKASPSTSATTKTESSQARKEIETTKKNVELTASLRKEIEKLEKQLKETLTAQQAAISSINEYTQKLSDALELEESSDANIWREVVASNEKREKEVENAVKKFSDTRLQVEKIKSGIENAKREKDTAGSSALGVAEESLIRVLYQLDNSEKEMSKAQAKHEVMEKYRDLFNKSREELENEIKAVIPNAKHGKKLTDEEVNLMIAHAHKKIEQLYKQIAKLEATEKLRFEEALNLQKEEDNRIADTKIALELAKRRSELENDYQKKVNSVKEELEEELRQQMKRQLAAHHDHLRERLEVQRFDLERQFELVHEEKLLEEKSIYASELKASVAHLKHIESVLKSRQQLDTEERKARELWLICQILKDSLKSKRTQSDKQPISLQKDINAIRETVKTMESTTSLASTVLETIPEQVVQNGVYTEDDLIERFKTVDKVCKRVALIGDEGGSIFRFFLSYLQSVLIFDTNNTFEDELNGKKEIDTSKLDTFDILARIRYCLNERNLEMSLRYANQLSGEPRRVAKDWISNMRAHLELRQVADVLQAQAASLTIRAVK
ncbi:Mitochondrial inner membrane protein-like protein [Dinothrombium tinctorium]|uniref:MICOS complex subunit MIC60 n=1 Tax=Dinothrombium tinctorium TaxID=1965070 RepID=A0A3S3S055_9ACAR|nr:Mitochondrial inner membrane protein-like protein [Dinothrombium tinctorium]